MSMVLKRYSYRAYPVPAQVTPIARLFGCCRVAYNDAIAARRAAWADDGRRMSYNELSARLTAVKKTPERAWLTEVSSVPLQQAVRHADRAHSNFVASIMGKRKGVRMGEPRFKKRSNRQAAKFTTSGFGHLTSTTHGVGFVTLVQEPDGRYYVSFVVDEPAPAAPPHESTRVAGMDVGLTDLAAIAYSDGSREKVANPRFLRSRERKLARAQRELSRKVKGSANRAKARVKVAVQHRKVRDARLDHHRKLALRLVRENQTVVIEGLTVRGLARTRLAKSIHDAGWGLLIQQLKAAASEHGTTVVVIDQWAPTSQTCAVCGIKDGKKPLGVRVWTCTECGARLDRDWNAAVNIVLAAGLAESLNACGRDVRQRLAAADPVEAGTHPEPPPRAHAA